MFVHCMHLTSCQLNDFIRLSILRNLTPDRILPPNSLPEFSSIQLTSEAAQTGHYANTSVRYTAIFHGCKNDNFQMKFFDIFLIFAQNIDCGYTLEPP